MVIARIGVVGVALALAACGSKQTEPAPKYTPVNSPEAKTKCPGEWKTAKKKREAALELGTKGARAETARAVLAHAECERAQFDKHAFTGQTHDRLLGAIRNGRDIYNTTRNLYKEVPNYGDVNSTLRAGVRLGELHNRFAEKLTAVRTPRDMTSTAEKAAFLSQLSTLSRGFELEASRAFANVIRTVRTFFDNKLPADDSITRWTQRACAGLADTNKSNAEHKHCATLLAP